MSYVRRGETPEVIAKRIAEDIRSALEAEERAGNLAITASSCKDLSARISEYLLEGYCGESLSPSELREIGIWLSHFDFQHWSNSSNGSTEHGLDESSLFRLIKRVNAEFIESQSAQYGDSFRRQRSYIPNVEEAKPL